MYELPPLSQLSLAQLSLEDLKDQFLDETDNYSDGTPREIDFWYIDRLLDFAIKKGVLELHIERGVE